MKKLVLVVDDETKRFDGWKIGLKGRVNVIFASSIVEAREAFAKHAGDLAAIAMDACVPGNSPNTPSLVRQFRETFNGPMVAISGSPSYREQLMDAGCNYQSPKDEMPTKILEVLGLPTKNLFEVVGSVTIPATTKEFIISNRLRILGRDTAPMSLRTNIGWMNYNFRDGLFCKIEEPSKKMDLLQQRLCGTGSSNKQIPDEQILDELGDTAETSLFSIWALTLRQRNGEKGALLVSDQPDVSHANVFYVRDDYYRRWVVRVYWFFGNGGWSWDAYSITNPWGRTIGDQIFSRKP